MRRVQVGGGEAPGEDHERILVASAMSMPASVLRILAPGSDRDVQLVIRIELARFIQRGTAQRFATTGDAWNAWVGNRGFVSLFPVRCPECQGRGFSVWPSPSGSAICRGCAGRRSITVRQRVVRTGGKDGAWG